VERPPPLWQRYHVIGHSEIFLMNPHEPGSRSEKGGKSGRVKLRRTSKRAKLVGSPSESGPIVDRCGFFSLGP
jgi:hypothetical protein